MKITDDIKYIGVNDYQTDLFEGQYEVPNGMSYNSYVILDDKITVMDTVDKDFGGTYNKKGMTTQVMPNSCKKTKMKRGG